MLSSSCAYCGSDEAPGAELIRDREEGPRRACTARAHISHFRSARLPVPADDPITLTKAAIAALEQELINGAW